MWGQPDAAQSDTVPVADDDCDSGSRPAPGLDLSVGARRRYFCIVVEKFTTPFWSMNSAFKVEPAMWT